MNAKDETHRMLDNAIEVYTDAARTFRQEEVEDAYANLWDAIDLHIAAAVAEAIGAEDTLQRLEALVLQYSSPEADIGAYCQFNWDSKCITVHWIKGAFDDVPRLRYGAHPGSQGAPDDVPRAEPLALLKGGDE